MNLNEINYEWLVGFRESTLKAVVESFGTGLYKKNRPLGLIFLTERMFPLYVLIGRAVEFVNLITLYLPPFELPRMFIVAIKD